MVLYIQDFMTVCSDKLLARPNGVTNVSRRNLNTEPCVE